MMLHMKTTQMLCVTVLAMLCTGAATAGHPVFGEVAVGHGVVLHYAQEGRGQAVIFVHGSISDYDYWAGEVDAFGRRYRAIAYSRRYDFPNHNTAIAGYSAVTDAEDLARFIRRMHLHRVDVVGHSYGALTALFLAIRHPELVHKLVLAEPPAVPLLAHLPGAEAARGKAMYADIERRMVLPMQKAFRAGRSEQGVAIFIDYVFNDPHAWDRMSAAERAATMRDAREWEVMRPTGTLFPAITPAQVRSIHIPTLVMSGAKSYPFLRLIDDELARLIPRARQVVFARSGHQMWYQQPRDCRRAVEAFLR